MDSRNSQIDPIFHQMATYNFDSEIKVSIHFEDFNSSDLIQKNLFENYSNDHEHYHQREHTSTSQSLAKRVDSFSAQDAKSSCRFHNNYTFSNVKNTPHIGKDNRTVDNRVSSRKNNNEAEHPHTVNLYSVTNNSIHLSSMGTMINEVLQPTPPVTTEKSEIFKLLDTVSENLIGVIKYYEYYHSLRKNQESCTQKFLTHKRHLFSLSYSVSVSIILPRENNRNFIHSFIMRTIQIANRHLNYLISFDQLRCFLNDLIQWTKHKKRHLEACRMQLQQVDNIIEPPTLSLTTKPNSMGYVRPNKRQIATEEQNKKNKEDEQHTVCLFSSGTPGNEISISINAEMLKNTQNTLNIESDKDSPLGRSHLYDHVTKRPKTTDDLNNQIVLTSGTWNPPASDYIHTDPCNSNLDNRIISINGSSSITSELNQHEHNFVINTPQSPFRRSISRDSGCGSPVMINEQNIIYPPHVVNQASTSNMSYVTSMNPHSSFTATGLCKYCGQLTSTMCLGCYKYHYCSSQCQEKDWPNHQKNCSL